MAENNNILHLDEMLGSHEMKVEWKNKMYGLKSTNDLTSEEYMRVMQLGKKFAALGSTASDEDATAKDVLEAVDTMLKIIGPELQAQEVPFSGQMLILTFWKETEESAAKKKSAKARK
jgi:hypothetical protein